MRRHRIWLAALMIMLILPLTPATGQDNARMSANIVVNADIGWPTRVVVDGYNPQQKAWLGVSFYPYGINDAIVEGKHTFIELGKGDFARNFDINVELLGGSFEFALWGKRVDKVDCTIEDCHWCKTNGYHLDDMLVYKSGLLTRLGGYGNTSGD